MSEDWLTLSDPDITEAELEAVRAVMGTASLSAGDAVEAFEAEFAASLGRRFAVVVASGTIGLMLVLRAYGIGPGDEVIASPHSWRETAHAIALVGATPVFAEGRLDQYRRGSGDLPVAPHQTKETPMPMLTIQPSGRTVNLAEGATILSGLLAAEEKIDSKCGGNAKCGSCHIFVQEGRKTLSKMQRLENERLDSIVGVGMKSRLACQARIGTENVTVELLGFNSGL